MGCDIHLFVEKNENGQWRSADKWTPSGYEEDSGRLGVAYRDQFYKGRNYALFAILADVRNGSGFAGCDTGDKFNPIAEPRGIPSDASEQVKAESERWECDGHSSSWFTVQELFDYDWTQTTKLRGYVNALAFWKWWNWGRERGEMPDEYCGDISGRIEKISMLEMQQRIAAACVAAGANNYHEQEKAVKDILPHAYCQIEQEQPYYKTVRNFWSDVIPKLLPLGATRDVRIVFWFDN